MTTATPIQWCVQTTDVAQRASPFFVFLKVNQTTFPIKFKTHWNNLSICRKREKKKKRIINVEDTEYIF